MEFKNIENKKYETTCGKTLWHSRNVAVCSCVIRTNPKDDTKIQVLAIKRGSAVSHTGKYCFPCGYLDWAESVEDAAVREIYEESGLIVDKKDLDFYDIDSNPEKFLQNVTIHFVHYYVGNLEPSLENASENEAESVGWFDFDEAEKLEWAFDHKKRLTNLIKNV